MNKWFKTALRRLEDSPRLQILMGCLVVLLTVGVIFSWDPLRVLNPSPPVQIVAAKGPAQIDEERLAELVASLDEDEAIYISNAEDGSWYSAFQGGTRGYIPVEKQITDRALLHPLQRICRNNEGRWLGCPNK